MRRILFGTSVYSRLIRWYIENDTSDEILAYTVEKEYLKENEFDGLPVVDFDSLNDIYDMTDISVLITCGYHQMNDIRKKIFNRCDELGYKIGSFYHSSAQTDGVKFGRGNIVMANALFHPFVEVGDANIFGEFSMVEQETIIADFNFIGPKTFLGSFIKVANNNDFGIGAIIGDRVEIGSYNLIGSGAILSKSIGENNIVAPDACRVQQSKRRLLDIMVESF